MALKVLAHFVPGDKVLDFVAPESDWLDVRWCAEDDDAGFYRELPQADVIWHVLRPLSGADLRRGVRLQLVHKLGAGVNTIDVETATKCGIAVATSIVFTPAPSLCTRRSRAPRRRSSPDSGRSTCQITSACGSSR